MNRWEREYREWGRKNENSKKRDKSGEAHQSFKQGKKKQKTNK